MKVKSKKSKVKKLKDILQSMSKVLIAYSGGVDSTFLVKIAKDTLGKENVLAVTAESATYPLSELKDAKRNARNIGVRHLVIHTDEFEDSNFVLNPANRCYYCKKELFSTLRKIAKKEGIEFVIDASNTDDVNDYRPGAKAKKEFGVRSPLQEAGFNKNDIRHLSEKIGLKTWDKPAMACLASRIPYGEKIEIDKLKRIETAEEFLQKSGFKQVRVRCHGSVARIEVLPKDIKLLIKNTLHDRIITRLKKMGFAFVTLDLQGYRTGSLNEVLKNKK